MITDIYPAREKYDGTMHACDLARLIPGVVYMNDMDAMKRYILSNAKPGDLVITMGPETSATSDTRLHKNRRTLYGQEKIYIAESDKRHCCLS